MGWAVESRQRLACLARSELGSSLRMSRNMADAVLFQPCAGRAEFAEQLRRRESLFGELTKRESALATAGVPFTLAGWCAVCERNTEFLLLSELRGSGWRSVALHLYASGESGLPRRATVPTSPLGGRPRSRARCSMRQPHRPPEIRDELRNSPPDREAPAGSGRTAAGPDRARGLGAWAGL